MTTMVEEKIEEKIMTAPAFVGDTDTKRFEQNGREVYEMVGSSLYHLHKSIENKEDRAELGELLEIYEHAHLFRIGWDIETINEIANRPVYPEEVRDFHLPFKSVVLDYPGSRNCWEPLRENPQITIVREIEPGLYRVHIFQLVRQYGSNIMLSFDFSTDRETGSITYSDHYEMACSESFRHMDIIMKRPDEKNIVLKPDDDGRVIPPKGDENCIRALIAGTSSLIIHSMSYINAPMNYVVREELPLTNRELRLKDKAIKPFFAKKPLNIVLDHAQVKMLMPTPGNGHHASPRPHDRRGHWRKLSAERFREKKMVWVRPADINKGMEWEKSGRTYKVVS